MHDLWKEFKVPIILIGLQFVLVPEFAIKFWSVLIPTWLNAMLVVGAAVTLLSITIGIAKWIIKKLRILYYNIVYVGTIRL